MTAKASEFESPRPNLVVSRNGFRVLVKMPNAILYEEGAKRMSIFVEPLATMEAKIAVRRADVHRWRDPSGEEPISDGERERIIENIRRALEFRGWILAVE